MLVALAQKQIRSILTKIVSTPAVLNMTDFKI